MARKTSDAAIPEYDFAEMLAADNLYFDLANFTTSTPGRINGENLKKFVHSYPFTKTAHGFVGGDVGKPLSGTTLLDDANPAHFPTSVIASVPDANTLILVSNGLVSFSNTLMEAGYVLATNGPYVYWDKSAVKYVSVRPADTIPSIREILYVLTISGSTVVARLIDWGPPAAAANVQFMKSATAADGDTTPSVLGLSLLVLNNTGPTTITQFDDGVDGQRIAVWDQNGNSTIDDGANIVCSGNIDLDFSANQTAIFERAGTTWVQTGDVVSH